MHIVTLYKYKRDDGGVTVSPIKPEGEYTEMYRLIANLGKMLKKGDVETTCIDVESTDGWAEIGGEAPESEDEISDTEALNIIMGGVEV